MRATGMGDSAQPSPTPADATEEKDIPIAQAHANSAPDDPVSSAPAEDHAAAPLSPRAHPESMPGSLPAAGMPQPNPALPYVTTTTTLDTVHGIAPIAEALIKTLAGKARTGRLDEPKALELLQQAILL
jgi:hypothetical protein